MKVPLLRIVRIELLKFFKRADLVTVLGLVVISFFYAINMGQGTGQAPNQSAIYWVANQLMLLTALFIGPVVMAYIGTQFLAVEIENGSVMLFEEKIRNRSRLYLGKNIAMTLICGLLFAACVSFMLVFYFFLIDRRVAPVSGELLGNHANVILLYIFCMYTYTFFFVPQVSFFLGSRFRPLSSIVMTVGVVLLCNYVLNFAPFSYINPFWSIMNLTDQVLAESGSTSVSADTLMRYNLQQVSLSVGYVLLFLIVGIKMFSKRDIQ